MIYHIYNTGGKLTEKEIEEQIQQKKGSTGSFISLYNSVEPEHKKLIKDKMYSTTTKQNFYLYYDKTEDTFAFNELSFYRDYRKLELVADTYKNGIIIIQRYKDSNITGTKYTHTATGKVRDFKKSDFSNKDLFEWYHSLHTCYAVYPLDSDHIVEMIPIIPEAIDALGMNRIRELKYSPVRIKREMRGKTNHVIKTVEASRETKMNYDLRKEASKVFRFDTPYTGKQVRDKLLPIYGKLGLNKTPKGTDLHDIFTNVKRTTFRELGNAKGYLIISTGASRG